MLKVSPLTLPQTLPNPEAMKPGNKNDYDPKFWEFHYDIYRYLERSSDDYVLARYNGILKKMLFLS
jgi:hypothetical protein